MPSTYGDGKIIAVSREGQRVLAVLNDTLAHVGEDEVEVIVDGLIFLAFSLTSHATTEVKKCMMILG